MDRKKNISDCDDHALIRHTLDGEKEAFSELVKRYQGRAYGVAVGIVGNRDDALDVVQESFVKAYSALKDFRFDAKFYTWFYRLLINKAIDKKREVSRNPGTAFDETWMMADDGYPTGSSEFYERPDETAGRRELREIMHEAIESLTENHRTVILLREVEGMSYQEIADVLDISLGTVMSRIHYGKEKLRELLSEYVRGNR
ncbi:MAG: sigma-70 family RNA polymerase sigma factor [Deltaproteobacteria bacterium]|nr:sigma-70 family RNA polymerase sigma factor [Deltaproteobacteria bacterium]